MQRTGGQEEVLLWEVDAPRSEFSLPTHEWVLVVPAAEYRGTHDIRSHRLPHVDS